MILLMYEPTPEHLDNLQRAAPDRSIAWAKSETDAQRLIEKAEVVMGNRYFLQSLPRATRLRWMQSNSVGVDLILREKDHLIEKNVTLTCVRGVYDAELAEHTLALLLALYRSIPLLRDEQRARRWRRHHLPTLCGSRCLVLGWGSLGKSVAYRLRAMGAVVTGARNAPHDTEGEGFTALGSASWRSWLPDTDSLIICLPRTPDTYHLVAGPELATLPSHAFVVNIGRGGTLDDEALLDALQNNTIAGAALDVFEREPLPADHPLWREPSVLISPHVGRSLERPPYRWQPLFEENLRPYESGLPLRNVVSYQKGY